MPENSVARAIVDLLDLLHIGTIVAGHGDSRKVFYFEEEEYYIIRSKFLEMIEDDQ